jgi:hypothetical protein
MILSAKIARYVQVHLPDDATTDQQYDALDQWVKQNCPNNDFVVDAVEVNGEPQSEHELIDEVLG